MTNMVLQSSGSKIVGVYRLSFMLVLSTTDERERGDFKTNS